MEFFTSQRSPAVAAYRPKVAFDWESREPWTVRPFPESEYRDRIARTRKAMAEQGFDALIAYSREGNEAAVRWLSNFRPFLGEAMVVVPAEGDPVLLATAAMHGEPMHSLFWQTWLQGAELVPASSSLAAEVGRHLGGKKSGKVGVAGLAQMPAPLLTALLQQLTGITLESADQALLQLRAIKSPLEVEKMRQAAQISGFAIKAAMEACQPGASEFQVTGLAHQVMFSLGAEHLAFDTAVVAGPRAGLKHGYPSGRLMQEGDMVFLDMGARVDGYHADLSRTIVIGEPNDYQRRMLQTAERMFAVWERKGGPGVAVSDLQAECEEVALHACFAEEYMNLGWGHGLGVSLFELPHLAYRGDTVLEEGMVFALEPMLVKLGVGTAVIEETVLITARGLEALSGLPTKIYS